MDPNDRLNIDPVTAASPEVWRVKLLTCVQSDTVYIIEESPEGVGYIFIPGAVANYTRRLRYILIWLQKQEVEALEFFEEVDAFRTTPSHPSLFLFRFNTNRSLVPPT